MRLIDADYLTTEIARLVVGGKHAIEEAGHGNFWINGLYDVKKMIDITPTIVPETTSGDLISREALKKQFANECLHNCYYCKLSKWDKEGACYNCALIDNAPTVDIPNYGGQVMPDTLQGWRYEERPQQEEKQYEIKVNIPDDVKEQLIAKLNDPNFYDSRRIVLDDTKTMQDCIIAYNDGFESARRLFERPQGEMQIDMSNNERFIVFNIKEIDGTYDITTKESCAKGYGCRGLPPTEVFKTMQEMYKWLHDWVGFDVVFAFEES